MTKLSLLSLCLIGVSLPALAQDTSASSSQPTGAPGVTMSAPPDGSSVSSDSSVSSEMPASSDESSEPAGPPVASKDALGDFFKICTDVASGATGASDRATADGWTPEEPDGAGPYRTVFAGAKDFSGLGTVELWGSVESYPTQKLGYCRVDFTDTDGILDFDDMALMGNLTGTTQVLDSNVYGSWESPDKATLVIADRTDGTVEIEYNLLLGGAKTAQK